MNDLYSEPIKELHPISAGDKVRLSSSAGYSPKQCEDIYTVDEVRTLTITAIHTAKDICLTKPKYHFVKVLEEMRKYGINTVTSQIESFIYVAEHPSNKNYVIVLDDYGNPKSITKIFWESKYDSYNACKQALVDHLKALLVFYS